MPNVIRERKSRCFITFSFPYICMPNESVEKREMRYDADTRKRLPTVASD
jgi:hypothetical protein